MTEKILVLASTSPARKMLLERLQLPFCLANPDIDETAFPNETAEALVKRLALAKADAVKHQYPYALVIGADQVGICEGVIFGKPLNNERALEYLRQASGKKVTFLCGLCLLDTTTAKTWLAVELYEVFFRTLSDKAITTYLHKEQPFGCAGGFKSEGLGVTLVEKFSGSDPTSLIGLPLIHLTTMLMAAGHENSFDE